MKNLPRNLRGMKILLLSGWAVGEIGEKNKGYEKIRGMKFWPIILRGANFLGTFRKSTRPGHPVEKMTSPLGPTLSQPYLYPETRRSV